MNAQTHILGSPIRRRGGFTLIEILIVVAVIVILAGIVVAIGVGVSSGAKDRATKLTLTNLDQAMGIFLKYNPEPSAATWLTALQAFPESASVIKDKVKFNGSVPQVLDGYGQAIQYLPSKSPPKSLPFGIFWSYGRDSQPNTADDLFSAGTAGTP